MFEFKDLVVSKDGKHKYEVKLKKINLDTLEKKSCKASRKSSGRMKSSHSSLLTKRKFTAPTKH